MKRFLLIVLCFLLYPVPMIDGRGGGGGRGFGGGGMRGGGMRVGGMRSGGMRGRSYAGARRGSARVGRAAPVRRGSSVRARGGRSGRGGGGVHDRHHGGRHDGRHGRHNNHGRHGGYYGRTNICPGCRGPIWYTPGWWAPWYFWMTVPWIVSSVSASTPVVVHEIDDDTPEPEVRRVSRKKEQPYDYQWIVYRDTQGNLLTEQIVSPLNQETMFIYDPDTHKLIEKRVLDLHGNQTIQRAAQGPISRKDVKLQGRVKVIERTVDMKARKVIDSSVRYEKKGINKESVGETKKGGSYEYVKENRDVPVIA